MHQGHRRRIALGAALAVAAMLMVRGPALAATSPQDAPQPAPQQLLAPAELEAFVDGVVRQAMADNHIAGASVAVVQDGRVLLKKGYGFASLGPYRPVDPDRTLFRLGPLSSIFTWILVLKEIEAGHMRLDAPVELYLPGALRIPDEGFVRPIRLRDLINHTPGFEVRVFGHRLERDASRVRPLRVYLRQEQPRRVREPQAAVAYSDYGVALAGASVAEIAGKPFESLVESEITGPLGMTHSSFREPHPPRAGLPAPIAPDLAAGISQGFRWTPQGLRVRPFEFSGQIAPAGAASSTAADMARLMLLLLGEGTLDGVSIYGPRTAAAFATPLAPPIPGAPAWRHGLVEQPLAGGWVGVGQAGETLSFASSMVVIPRLKLGVFVSTNTAGGEVLADALPRRIVARFFAPPAPPPERGSKSLIAGRTAFEGEFLTDSRAQGGLEAFVDRLVGETPVRVTQDGRLAVGRGAGLARYTLDGPIGSGRFLAEDGARAMIFEMKGGRGESYVDPSGAATYRRVAAWRGRMVLGIATALVALVALLGLADVFTRGRRDFRESSSQRRAGLVQTTQCALWLTAIGLFGGWAAGATDPATLIYDWPGLPLVIASACALVAGGMAAFTLALLPMVWRGGRRVDSWSGLRKVRFTLTALLFLTYAALLASWGALQPWGG